MGWLFTVGQSRKELIQARITGWKNQEGNSRCLAHCTRGNVLWSVWEVYLQSTGQIRHFIACDLMQKSGGWGYKDLSEIEHPMYFSCPLKYLKMVPVACQVWRNGVKEWHEHQRQERLRKKRVKQYNKDRRKLLEG